MLQFFNLKQEGLSKKESLIECNILKILIILAVH